MRNEDVIAANRQYFDENAATYDREEACVVDASSQKLVEDHLRELVARLRQRFGSTPLRVLDAGGGSGNLSLKLIELGMTPDLVDVSQSMIDIFLSKTPPEVRGSVGTYCADLDTFFSQSAKQYHLICFSSVLHHLLDYRAVLSAAVAHLEPGGMIYTVHDPALSSRFWNRLEMADHHLSSFRRFFGYVSRRLRGAPAPAHEHQHGADEALAEPHVGPGIDDFALRDYFVSQGMKIVWHRRYMKARTIVVSLLHVIARRARGFSFAVEKTS